VETAESTELCLTIDDHDQFGGELVAGRESGPEVHIRVRSLDEKHSRVSVRVKPVALALASSLQERIAEKLSLGEARRLLLGGNVAEGVYRMDLDVAIWTARRALRTLEVTITTDEVYPEGARIDGRLKDSTPVRIRIDRTQDQKMKVTFIAGDERADDQQAFARRLKEEYESRTNIKGQAPKP